MSHLGLKSNVSSLFSFSLESQLEIDKVHEAEQQGIQTSELSTLHQEVKQSIKSEEEIEAQKENPPDEGGFEDPNSSDETQEGTQEENSEEEPDTSSDPDPEQTEDKEEQEPEEKEDPKEEPKKEEKEEVSSESFRELQYEFEAPSEEVSLESLEAVKRAAGKTYHGVKYVVSSLGALGIAYGPKIASKAYKGVIYGFALLGKGLVISISSLTKYIERRTSAFDKLNKDIQIAKETLQLIDDKDAKEDTEELSSDSDEPIIQFKDEKTINYLKIGESLDLSNNIERLNTFVSDYVEKISKAIHTENKVVNLAVERSNILRFPDPVEFLQYNFNLNGLGRYSHSDDDSLTELFRSKEVMPGDVVLIAKLPNRKIKRVLDLRQAYKESDIHLELNKESFKVIEGVNYMTSQELSQFLDSLSKLCDLCISHQKYYEGIKKLKLKSRYSFKRYFDNLLDNKSKVGVEDSFIENMYMKNVFVDKVYIPAAMDIHDYAAKVISHGLSFAKSNLEHLR